MCHFILFAACLNLKRLNWFFFLFRQFSYLVSSRSASNPKCLEECNKFSSSVVGFETFFVLATIMSYADCLSVPNKSLWISYGKIWCQQNRDVKCLDTRNEHRYILFWLFIQKNIVRSFIYDEVMYVNHINSKLYKAHG